jgi:hypothetical protein
MNGHLVQPALRGSLVLVNAWPLRDALVAAVSERMDPKRCRASVPLP